MAAPLPASFASTLQDIFSEERPAPAVPDSLTPTHEPESDRADFAVYLSDSPAPWMNLAPLQTDPIAPSDAGHSGRAHPESQHPAAPRPMVDLPGVAADPMSEAEPASPPTPSPSRTAPAPNSAIPPPSAITPAKKETAPANFTSPANAAQAERLNSPGHQLEGPGRDYPELNPAPPASSGTRGAHTDPGMKTAAEPGQLEDLPVPNLPGRGGQSEGFAQRGEDRWTQRARLSEAAPNPAPAPFSRMDGLPGISSAPQAGADAGQTGESGEIRLPGLETVETQIQHGAMRLRQRGAGSLSVVVQPDARTELHLHLSVRDGQIAVQARVSRGDGAIYQAHWEQLQHDLASHGIRLATLQTALSPGTAGGDWGGHFRDWTDPDPAPDESFRWPARENGPGNNAGTAPAVPAAEERGKPGGWERWA